jgi:hypothetical protein
MAKPRNHICVESHRKLLLNWPIERVTHRIRLELLGQMRYIGIVDQMVGHCGEHGDSPGAEPA